MSPLLLVILLAFAFIIVLALSGVTIYTTVQINQLSLPISQIYAYSAIALPIFTSLAMLVANRVRSKFLRLTSDQKALLLLVITILQTIYEAIIATLAVRYMSPNCSLEERWKALYTRKDGDAISRIQDRFVCCGFNTVVDRAWPFPRGRPEDGLGADQCRKMFGRDRACGEVWREAQLRSAWIFLSLAGSVFIFQIFFLISHSCSTKKAQPARWMRFLGQTGNEGALENGFENPDANRRLIDQGDSVVEQEPYRDDAIGGNQGRDIRTDNPDRNRPIVEPSGLAADNSGEHWNDGRL